VAARQGTVRNLQGVKMGRPSWISIRSVLQDGAITAMRVGGSAVVVGTGTIALR
jgi:predicted PhzF superfamily epimerase YddE/YHI9